ncbi:DUF262 domain-containing protein [Micromonospora sp. NPDC050397]|uniref:DUF262 domain-containing protein n=1 Tax=Micromonospora sp. NPDC050397 TaxID=3364279 RepID=UPI00385180D7
MTTAKIDGKARTVRELLDRAKFSIDYYQREYEWQEKQISELIDDLTNKFLLEHDPAHHRSQVEHYPHYFLGSIIVSQKDRHYIVDGQQRLTSLTLLLMLLRQLLHGTPDQGKLDSLIMSERYGQVTFNIGADHDDNDRRECMTALWEGQPFDITDRSESVRTIWRRFHDLEEMFPSSLRGPSLPYFVDWLLHNVHLVEITAHSDDDAYTIFETMNDRGLNLSPTGMLKGYLLANITDQDQRDKAAIIWRDRIAALTDVGKEVDADFFKNWLRSQYATKIRERKKGARPEDFDLIGTEFHRWLRGANHAAIGKPVTDFYTFVHRDLQFYCRWYLTLLDASRHPTPGLQHVMFNAAHRFTLQNMLLLAPLTPDDDNTTATTKIRLVARYIDILLAWRVWNSRSIDYSTMQYAMFLVMRDIRGLEPGPLAARLRDRLDRETDTFATNPRLKMHQQNRRSLHELLARMTDHIETRSGLPSRYIEYANHTSTKHEIEHIWADHPERHADEFSHPSDFAEHRNRIGGLLLLPKSFNASYGDLPYDQKLPHYHGQNLLAKSLHPHCYQHNPGFLKIIADTGIPFRAHEKFDRADLELRCELYRHIAEQVWNPNDLLAPPG